MSDLGTCAGERRRCSAQAVVVRQGRALCSACDERRRKSHRGRQQRRRANERRAHDQGDCDPAKCRICKLERKLEAKGVEIRGPGKPRLDDDSPTRAVSIRAPESLWDRAREAAKERGCSVAELVRDALESHLP